MRRALFIFLSLVLALAGWSMAGAEDVFYVIPTVKNNYAPVPKTGQTTSYGSRDDGALEKGVAWPTPRFADNGNGTVTDQLTGLIWMKIANALGSKTWTEALLDASKLQAGFCGLTDGSKPGDWRLPNARELQSLIDFSKMAPALPSGHPFAGVSNGNYWSSTNYNIFSASAWKVNLGGGMMNAESKTSECFVWCVRDDK